MLRLRKSNDRGQFDHGWLQTQHTFSFAAYHDAAHHNFRDLRVINEDVVAPGEGFGMHGHRDMEIVTVVLSGALEHRDSLGHGEILRPGELQRMTAGAGILHSEFNPSPTEPVHLYQIWLFPREKGLKPGYEQKAFDPSKRVGKWQLAASPDGADGSLTIQQDARIWLVDVPAGTTLTREIAPGRHGWLQALRGSATVGGQPFSAGDGLAISDESRFDVVAQSPTELLYFDLR